MGQKGSKEKGSAKPKSPGGPSSPLNNATYWEAEEDPDWDNCVMVVATQKSRLRQLAASNDSLAKSLHKEVQYSPLNVSRRSPDYSRMVGPAAAIPPDCRYPAAGHRKRQNQLMDTGWHACFKNNNYVFVRNADEGQCDDKWKENNDSDVTFIISTSKPIKEGKEEQLVVSLHDTKPKIRRRTPTPPKDTEDTKTPDVTRCSTGTRSKSRSDKKKSSSWLKKFRTPGRNRSVKDGSADETTLILGLNSDDSPEGGLTTSTIHDSEFYPPLKESFERVKSSKENMKDPSPSTIKNDTPLYQSEITTRGPQTSTPKEKFQSETLKNATQRNGTPYRPLDTRLSVRRRLPYEDMTPDGPNPDSVVSTPVRSPHQEILSKVFDEDLGATPKLDMPLSPIKKTNGHHQDPSNTNFSASTSRLQRRSSCFQPSESDIAKAKSCSALQRRASCVPSRNLKESLEKALREGKSRSTENDLVLVPSSGNLLVPSSGNLLHPSSSNNDIPFVDSEADVSFDERRGRRHGRSLVKPCKSASDVSFHADDSNNVTLTIGNSVTPDKKSLSSSEPNIGIEPSAMTKEAPFSPMEAEENISFNQHAKHLFSPDDSTVTFSPYTPLKRKSAENPISCWLKEIRLLTDSECLNALQAKELQKEDWVPNALAVGNAQETSEKIWELGSAIQSHVEDMLECLKSDKSTSTPLSLKVAQFCSYVVELLKMTTTIKQVSQAEAKIRKACADLLGNVNKGNTGKDWKIQIKLDLENMQKVAQILVQQLLLKELHVIVNCVEKAANINNLKRSVFAVILLGRMNPTFCELMTKLGVVRSLLAICVEKKWHEMHPCVLRALTVLTCVPTAIRSFEESGGVDCLCDVLSEAGGDEGARSEAAGLVAQITAPWTEGSGYVLRSVTHNSATLVRAISNLAASTDNSEVFLLSSAALANLSFADDALKKMKEYDVLQILVTACRTKSHAASLFIKDQVATVLANMAAKDDFRASLCSGGSLFLLLSFLQLSPASGGPAPQLAACERVQQKAAIALARLCTDSNTSNIVAEMKGIQRLVKLCKDRKERNDSDSVLVACLAALRKIAAVRQKDEVAKLGAQELIEPRLWDAFLAHSSKRESYV